MPIIPTGEGRGELEVKKSRFLALIYPLSRLNLHPKEMVKELKSMYKDQRHVVHAYRSLGAHEEGTSDDGEPSGTSGPPILDFLRRQNIEDTAVFVIRWFGGIKLGPGGLVRAYTAAVQDAWTRTPQENFIVKARYPLVICYEDLPLFEKLAKKYGLQVIEKEFTTEVTLQIEFPEDHFAA
jgi:uncharacterized YigZ family protein